MLRLAAILSIVLIAAIACTQPALAAHASGAQLFELHCAGCHINGGNIVRRGKTLKLGALQRNGYDTLEAIATIVANGKANMSAYKDRLTPTEINTVSTYVLDQAAKNWRS